MSDSLRCALRATGRARLLIAFLLLLTLAPHLLLGQPEDNPELEGIINVTRTFAIRNARIVQGPGRVIEHGTVVVRDGLITDVGTNIQIPFDAEIIEGGDSLVVYAGFIDGLGKAGVTMPKPPENLPKVPRPGEPPNDRAGIQPERDVRTFLDPKEKGLDSLRMAGFTVSHVAPRGGMLQGSGAVILLGGRTPAEMVLRGDASLVAAFEGANDVYPSTTMAIMAVWRNLYRRAEIRKRGESIYSESPSGVERPLFDPSIYAFFPVIEGRKPVFFQAANALDVGRALQLQSDLGFPIVITGLKDGRFVANQLKEQNVSLFLSLDLPKEAKKGDGDKKDSSAKTRSDSTLLAADTSIGKTPPNSFFIDDRRTISPLDLSNEQARLERTQGAVRREFYSNAAELQKKGVRFGFSTLGAKPEEIRENLRLMIENGLPEDAALSALTVDAAAMLGLEKSMGTVDRGKMGNLVVTNGPYFDKKSQVRFVFVDGRKFAYEQKTDQKKDSLAKADTAKTRFASDSLVENRLLSSRRDGGKQGSVLIKNATVLTVTKGTLENTDIAVVDGKITAIGKGLSAPRGAETIDATGMFVMPGIVDAHSHIAISDINEWTNPVTAEVWVGDVLDPFDVSIYRALAGGTTASHVMHGSANVIGGQCETIKHRYGTTDPNALRMDGAPRTIKFALGENPTRVHGRGFNVQPSTRMGVEQVVRRSFTEAQRYTAAKERYERGGKKNSRAVPPAYDLRMETLSAILRGEILVHCHSYRADEILMLMRVFREFGIKRLVFQHVNEGFKVAPELADFGAMASVFADWWAYKFEVYYSTAYNAAILTRNGVVTSINSDSPELNRHLNHEAAKTMKYGGLTQDEALALITINPARQLGVEDRIGSIEVGKEGDLALFSAHPLSVYSICQKTIVDGVVRFDRASDPDDMRIEIDPKNSIETATIWHEEEDRCMQGTDHLFKLMEGK